MYTIVYWRLDGNKRDSRTIVRVSNYEDVLIMKKALRSKGYFVSNTTVKEYM